MPAKQVKVAVKRHELLVEIGTEEIPAGYLIYADQENPTFFTSYFVKAIESVDTQRVIKLRDLRF